MCALVNFVDLTDIQPAKYLRVVVFSTLDSISQRQAPTNKLLSMAEHEMAWSQSLKFFKTVGTCSLLVRVNICFLFSQHV